MKWILSTVLGLGVAFSSSLPVFAQPSCETKATQPGTLALESGNITRLTSRQDRSQNAKLASVTLSCSAGMKLTISVPTAQVPTPLSTPGVEVWDGLPPGGQSLGLVTGANPTRDITVTGPFTDRKFFLDFYATGNPLGPGRYIYNLILKVTPQ